MSRGRKRLLGKIVGVVAVVFFVVAIFIGVTGPRLISSLFDPSIDFEYYAALGEFQKIEPGGFTIRSFPSNRESIGGWYALSDVVFDPCVESVAPWGCEDKRRVWGEVIKGNKTDTFDIQVKIPIPEDPRLEGKTVNGILKMTLEYPEQTGFQKFVTRREYLEERVSLHIFSRDELKTMNRMTEYYLVSILLFIFLAWIMAMASVRLVRGPGAFKVKERERS